MVKLEPIRLHEIALEYAVARGDVRQEDVPADIREVKDPVIKKAWKSYGVKQYVRETISKELDAKLMGRNTLDRYLAKYPRPPRRKVEPEYKRFWDIPTVKAFSQTASKTNINNLLEFWLFIKKNPENWLEEDYRLIALAPNWWDSLAIERGGAMSYHKQQSLRAWCKYSNPRLFARLSVERGILHTKGHKRKKGRKREWFLTPNELARYIQAIPDSELDHLTVVLNGSKNGDRWSGMVNTVQPLTYGSFDYKAMTVKVWETKTAHEWIKPMDKVLASHIEMLWGLRQGTTRRIRNKEILCTLKTPIIERGYNYHLNLMKVVGKKAGLAEYNRIKYRQKNRTYYKWEYVSGIPMSLHLLRHTFAFICSINDIPLEITAELGGWDDVNTLKDFYYYVPPAKLIKAYKGINWDKPTPQIFLGRIKERDVKPTEDELKDVDGVE